MNYLALAQRLRLEASMTGSGPTTVVGNANNEYARACNWIADADVEIQAKYDDWRFMWAQFSLNTTASDGEYTETEITGSAAIRINRYDLDSFRYFLTANGVVNEQYMSYYDYSIFRERWLFGAARSSTGQPQDFSFKPDKNMVLGPKPNDIYTITGDFYRRPVRMTADADIPVYPEEFHLAAVWWALVKYAGLEENSAIYSNAQNQLGLLWWPMERRERPMPSFGSALA